MNEITLRECQSTVDAWIKSTGVSYFSEMTILAQLVEEVSELARIISRTYGEQLPKEGEEYGSIEDELADILFVLICLANQAGVNFTTAMNNNIVKKS
jgi:NTP pyrophosphatase (non-canonical NTP hydrolase)